MSILPLIHRPYNLHFFNNPLHGILYNAQSIQKKVEKKQDLSTISYHSSSQRKMIFSTINPLKNKSIHKLKQENLDSSFQAKPFQTINPSKLKKYNLEMSLSDNSRVQSSFKCSSRQSKSINDYKYPEVQIIPLHLINRYDDIAKNRFYISLQQYFRLFFHTIMKHNSQKLVEHLDKFIPVLKSKKMLDVSIQKPKWPKELWQIKSTKEFLQISSSYDQTSQYWTKYILVLINYYCIPHKSIRESSLENLQLSIHKLIKERHFIEQPKEKYVFMTEQGSIIQDFVDIPLLTTKLYFTKRQSIDKLQEKFKSHCEMVKKYAIDSQNKQFVNRLRHHFRKQIVPDKYCEETINYQRNVNSKDKQRKRFIQKAKTLLQKKTNSRLKFHKVASNQSRIKSRSQIWSEDNIQNNITPIQKVQSLFQFHIYLNDKKKENQILEQFKKYKNMGSKHYINLKENEILIKDLLQNNYELQEMSRKPFQSRRIKTIFEIILNNKLKDDWQIKEIIEWNHFLEFSILTAKDIQKLIKNKDCYQLVRNFVQDFLEMKEDDYFRDQLTSKLFSIVQGSNETCLLMEEVLWNWLGQNNFIRMGAIQRQLLWNLQQRSKKFYLLILSLVFATFKTTLLDLAYQLLV